MTSGTLAARQGAKSNGETATLKFLTGLSAALLSHDCQLSTPLAPEEAPVPLRVGA